MKQNFKMTAHCNKYLSSTPTEITSFMCIKQKFYCLSVGEYSFQKQKMQIPASAPGCKAARNISPTLTTKKLGEHQIYDCLFFWTHQRAMSAEQITGLQFKKRRWLKRGDLDTRSPCVDAGSVTNHPGLTTLPRSQHRKSHALETPFLGQKTQCSVTGTEVCSKPIHWPKKYGLKTKLFLMPGAG